MYIIHVCIYICVYIYTVYIYISLIIYIYHWLYVYIYISIDIYIYIYIDMNVECVYNKYTYTQLLQLGLTCRNPPDWFLPKPRKCQGGKRSVTHGTCTMSTKRIQRISAYCAGGANLQAKYQVTLSIHAIKVEMWSESNEVTWLFDWRVGALTHAMQIKNLQHNHRAHRDIQLPTNSLRSINFWTKSQGQPNQLQPNILGSQKREIWSPTTSIIFLLRNHPKCWMASFVGHCWQKYVCIHGQLKAKPSKSCLWLWFLRYRCYLYLSYRLWWIQPFMLCIYIYIYIGYIYIYRYIDRIYVYIYICIYI